MRAPPPIAYGEPQGHMQTGALFLAMVGSLFQPPDAPREDIHHLAGVTIKTGTRTERTAPRAYTARPTRTVAIWSPAEISMPVSKAPRSTPLPIPRAPSLSRGRLGSV